MSSDSFDVPILFLIYKNPEITRIVFEQIRKVKPNRLYIAADGPHQNKSFEKEECELTRRIVDHVDWVCNVRTRFLPENLGLKLAVSSAIDWFFSEVDEGIILEYDCLATVDFFHFCKQMLIRYKDDNRIFCISGGNTQNGIWRGDGDYYYSNLFGCWGWATWKRSWKHWRPNLPNYERFVSEKQINNFFQNSQVRKYWTGKFDDIHYGRNTTTWAFCFLYAQMSQHGLCVVPNSNLVSNIGFSKEGTHAKDPNHPLANIPTQPLVTFRRPTLRIGCVEADELTTNIASYMPISKVLREFLATTAKLVLPNSILQYIRNRRLR